MSDKTRVTFVLDAGAGRKRTPAMLELMDAEMSQIEQFALHADSAVCKEFEPGRYLLRLRRPDGGSVQRVVTVEPGKEQRVEFSASRAENVVTIDKRRRDQSWRAASRLQETGRVLRTMQARQPVSKKSADTIRPNLDDIARFLESLEDLERPEPDALFELQQYSKGTADSLDDDSIASIINAAIEADFKTAIETNHPLDKLWMRVWRRDGSSWQIDEEGARDFCRSGDWSFKVPPDGYGPCLLELGGPLPRRFVVLPPGVEEIELEPVPHIAAFSLRIVSNNPSADAMLDYLTVGDVASAQAMVSSEASMQVLIDDLEAMLYSKFAPNPTAPVAAALASYLLLDLGLLARYRSWLDNLADHWNFHWLPDGLIIRAWLCMQATDTHSTELAARIRQDLIEAGKRGLPLYTRGLRMLVDGLTMLCSTSPDDAEAGDALARVAPYAEAAIWREPRTSFHGLTPDQPSMKYVFDMPEDHSGIHTITD